MLYFVEGDKLVDVKGDPAHPITRGGLCVKLKSFPEHHYQADRLLYPMRRTGPKEVGQFERVSETTRLPRSNGAGTALLPSTDPRRSCCMPTLGYQGVLNALTAGDASSTASARPSRRKPTTSPDRPRPGT